MSTILIVEDHPDYRRYLRGVLQDTMSSVDIHEAGDVAEADASIAALNPDLILTDIRLPDGSGFEIARRIGRDHPNSSVVFVTGFGNVAFKREAYKLGAVAFFTKTDLVVGELVDSVTRALCEDKV